MRRLLVVFCSILFSVVAQAQFQGLVINEFSQGNGGNREYIEIVVVGTRTCTDSTADIRGWILDDQNGWYGTSNSTPGHYRFENDPNWATVPFGSVILLYNSNDKNNSITLADDPTDANGDLSYIVPIGSPYIEQYASIPGNTSGPSYSYPGATTTTGYVNSTNQWQFYIALNNTNGDVISLVSPANRSAAYFSIGYGYTIASGFQNPTVSISNVAASNNAYLSGAGYANATQWIISPVPSNETPGLANGGANTAWIQSMRLGRPMITINPITPSVCFGNMVQTTTLYYNWTYQSPTHYSITWNALPANNFSAITNALLPSSPISITIPAGTPAGTYTGTISVTNATGTSCTSQSFTITVNAQPIVSVSPSSTTKCSNGNGVLLSASGADTYSWSPATGLSATTGSSVIANPFSTTAYTVVGTDINGCSDSAVSTVSVSRPVIFDTIEVSGCDEVVYNGVIYSGSTTLIDTISSTVTVCDSIIRTVNIIVNPSPQITISPNQTICKGDSIVLRATAENASIFWQGIGTGDSIKVAPGLTTTYTAIATDTNGCANSAMVTIAVNDFDVQIAANPNPVIAGTTLQLQTSANSSYSILSWQPFFNNPIAYRQTWIADTSSMVKVVARSATGCIDTDSIYIIVDPLGDVFIPTAFTPNGDGRNDVFTIGGGNFKSFDLKIFNRWGQIVFQSNERSKGWDGRIDGKDALPGAYVYNLSCTLKDGKKINRSGTILLIR